MSSSTEAGVVPVPAERFKAVTNQFLKFICDSIAQLYDEGLTDITPKKLELPIQVVDGYDATALIGLFVDCHADWDKVVNRDADFILEVVPRTYKKIPFDVSILSLPLRLYLEWQKHGLDGSFDEEDWPITSADITILWNYFRAMIGTACNHIHLLRKPHYTGDEFTYRNGAFFKSIDIQNYVTLFGFTLNRP